MAVFQVIPKGDLALVGGTYRLVAGVDHLRNKIRQRCRFFLGEWWLDPRQGIPYRRDVFVKNPNVTVVRSIFRRVLSTTPGVKVVRRFALTIESSTRKMKIDYEVTGTDGELATDTITEFLVAT